MSVTHGGNVFEIARRRGWNWREIADFSASINPLGPSPTLRAAVMEAFDRVVHYPEAYAGGLRARLAAHWNVDAACLLTGNGATDLIHFFARQMRPPRVSLAAPVFSEFHRAFPQADLVPFDAGRWPTEGLIIVTRPANPTGALPDLEAYLAATSNPVLIDESFLEFTGCESLMPRVTARPNLFVLRSLTKFYAIPGLRAGALAAAPETIARWMPAREPWQLNVLAEAAVMAAIGDEVHAARTVEFVAAERVWLAAELLQIPGLDPQPSVANYLLIGLAQPAAPLVQALESAKVLVRNCSGWPGVPFDHAIRIAVRPRPENLRLLAALRGFLCQS